MEFIHIFPMDSPTHNTHTKEIDVLAGGKNIKKKTKRETVIVYQMHCNVIYRYRNHLVVI